MGLQVLEPYNQPILDCRLGKLLEVPIRLQLPSTSTFLLAQPVGGAPLRYEGLVYQVEVLLHHLMKYIYIYL